MNLQKLVGNVLVQLCVLVFVGCASGPQFIPEQLEERQLSELALVVIKGRYKDIIIDGEKVKSEIIYLSPGSHSIEYQAYGKSKRWESLVKSMEEKGFTLRRDGTFVKHEGSIFIEKRPLGVSEYDWNTEYIYNTLLEGGKKYFFPKMSLADEQIGERIPEGDVSASNLELLFSNKTVSGTHERKGYAFKRFFSNDGTIYGENEKNGARQGKWRASSKGLCVQWADKKEKCRIVTRENNIIRQYKIDKKGKRVLVTSYSSFETSNTNQIEIDLKVFQGEWRIVGLEKNGVAYPKTMFSENNNAFFYIGNISFFTQNGKTIGTSTFTINPDVEPKRIDVTNNSNGVRQLGIYKFEDDRLIFCVGSNQQRPQYFSTTENSGHKLFKLKRISSFASVPSDMDGIKSYTLGPAQGDLSKYKCEELDPNNYVRYLGDGKAHIGPEPCN